MAGNAIGTAAVLHYCHFCNRFGPLQTPTHMTAEPACCLLGEIDKDSLNADFDGGAVRRQISSTVEVVLVNNGSSKKPLRSLSLRCGRNFCSDF
jgi:hypothetical protein